MVVNFCSHVIGEITDIQQSLRHFVIFCRGHIVATDKRKHVLIIINSLCIIATGRNFIYSSQMLNHLNRVAVDTVVGFYIGAVVTFAHVVNAIILAVIEHHHLAATLVIHTRAFQKGTTHSIFNIVTYKAVAVVTQVKSLVLVIHALTRFE